MSVDLVELVKRLLNNDRRALARLITLVESRDPRVTDALAGLYEHTGNSFIIGITGPPGAGKSTLADQLIAKYRAQGKTVGVVAIDPSSLFSGGALLGDRVRMGRHATDPDVFIRSLGSRGCYGGLSGATSEVVSVMDAFGFDVILVETVGVGQTELDIMELAHTVVVVFVPESGDVVQTMKAGLTEIADIFVVNKSDRVGAQSMVRELSNMVEMSMRTDWKIPVLMTQAYKNVGTDELVENIEQHHQFYLTQSEDSAAVCNLRMIRFVEIIAALIGDRLNNCQDTNGQLGELIHKISSGDINPYAAAKMILDDPKMFAKLLKQEGEST